MPTPPRTIRGTDTTFCSKYGIGDVGAVLIRPDGFVAWSSSDAAVLGSNATGTPDPSNMLKPLMRKILCLDSRAAVGTCYADPVK